MRARWTWWGETVAAGASPADARKWWLGELAMHANKSGVELTELGDHARPRWPGSPSWSPRARSTTSWRARCWTASWPARAGRTRSSRPAAWRSSATTGALAEAVDAAIAANPDIAAKIRDGKVAAAGALVGAVMKATKGQADAGRARELILQRLTYPLIGAWCGPVAAATGSMPSRVTAVG